GLTPIEAIQSMTKHGGAAMDMPDELGQIQPGFFADLLLIDGDPLSEPAVLVDRRRILAVMKDGQFQRRPA
ncbi:MAG: amidohydrolase family protein, partial [Planctomycetales bacterium]|nr:amidohydrolase family protein [Planctomycetales bacterium]